MEFRKIPFVLKSFIVSTTLLSAARTEDFCESCVVEAQCPFFASLNKSDQRAWLQAHPCNNHPDDYGAPPAYKDDGNIVCCPNRVWGLENQLSSRLKHLRSEKIQNTPYNENLYYNRQTNTYSKNYENNNNQERYIQNNLDPKRLTTTNKNNEPDKSQWGIGNQNNNRNPNIWSTSINQVSQRSPYFYNWRDYNKINPILNNQTKKYPVSGNPNSSNNPYRKPSNSPAPRQCARLTKYPPSSQSGCCGQEASGDDRINGTPFKLNGNNEVQTKLTKSIDGGSETELNQYPWTVLISTSFVSEGQISSANCGGSIISPRYVLTAAHCLSNDNAAIQYVRVFLAEYNKKTFPVDCKNTKQGPKCIENLVSYAERVFVHPGFEESRLRNDIALIKLQQDAPYTEYIRPICLPSINIDDPEFSRLALTAAGWGRDGPFQTDVKQATTIHLVPQDDCRRYYPDLTPRHLCAAGYTGQDTCKGDSGGPLMVKYHEKYFVVGVVSGKRTDVRCGSTVPSLYTNVFHYLDWIQSTIQTG